MAGTVVLDGFNPSVIQGGVNGWLRQEFRELELLDDITTLGYNTFLHPYVQGDDRI